MIGALVIVVAMVVMGVLLFVTDVIYYRRKQAKKAQVAQKTSDEIENKEDLNQKEEDHGEFCCGKHLVCDKTGLSPIDDEIIYYDDEELDRFIGRDSESYSPDETEEFRDVLMTLLPEDVAGWARSITLRKIELPQEVKDELLMIVGEMRK